MAVTGRQDAYDVKHLLFFSSFHGSIDVKIIDIVILHCPAPCTMLGILGVRCRFSSKLQAMTATATLNERPR